MSALPLDVSSALAQLHTALEALEAALSPMYSYSSLAQLNTQLPTDDMMKVNTAVAYALQSLYFVCMQTYGEDLTDHPLNQELDRIKDYIKQVQSFLSAKSQPPATPHIDKETATRFINHQVSQQVKTEEALAASRAVKGSTPVPKATHLTWKQDLDRILGTSK